MRNKLTKFMETPWTWGTYTKFSLVSILLSFVCYGWVWYKYFGWEPWVLKAIKEWRKERSEKKASQQEMFHNVYEEVKD